MFIYVNIGEGGCMMQYKMVNESLKISTIVLIILFYLTNVML